MSKPISVGIDPVRALEENCLHHDKVWDCCCSSFLSFLSVWFPKEVCSYIVVKAVSKPISVGIGPEREFCPSVLHFKIKKKEKKKKKKKEGGKRRKHCKIRTPREKKQIITRKSML